CPSVADARNLVDALDGAHAFHHAREMDAIVHADDQAHDADTRVIIIDHDAFDGRVDAGNARRQHRDRTAAFFQIDAHLTGKLATDVIRPAQRHQPLRFAAHFLAVVAAVRVYDHA